MASESPISKLAAQPLKVQVAVLVGAMIVLFGVYYQLYYSTMGEELQNSKTQYTRHEKQNTDLKKKKAQWAQMIQDKEDLDLKLSTNQVSLPRTAALPSFIGHLQRQAAVAGVTFKIWSRQKEQPVTGYVKVPVSVEVFGTFHQILKYYHLLNKTTRIITVEDFSLEPLKSNSDEVLLQAKFRATTFRQPDGAVPAEEPEAPKAGMIDKGKDAKAKKEAQVNKATGGKTDEQGNPDAPSSGVDRLKNPGAK